MSTSWQWAKANPDAAARKIRELERENAALRQDKARLDWLEENRRGVNVYFDPTTWMVDLEKLDFETLRAAIDAAREGPLP